jgi:hypothetical protein
VEGSGKLEGCLVEGVGDALAAFPLPTLSASHCFQNTCGLVSDWWNGLEFARLTKDMLTIQMTIIEGLVRDVKCWNEADKEGASWSRFASDPRAPVPRL